MDRNILNVNGARVCEVATFQLGEDATGRRVALTATKIYRKTPPMPLLGSI